MAANINVYSKELLNSVNSSKNIKAIWQGLFLDEYVDSANFKKLFYCDDVIITTDSQGKQIIIGLIELNGVNASMRDPKRLSNLRLVKNAKEYIALNDSGLNTYAKIETALVGEHAYPNYIKVKHIVKSAFYSPTREYGVFITIKQPDGTIVAQDIEYRIRSIVASKETYIVEQIIENGITQAGYVKGNTLLITPFTINDEGEKRIDTLPEITLKSQLQKIVVQKVDSMQQKPTTDQQIIYMDGDEYIKMLNLYESGIAGLNMIYPYSDPDMENKLEAGKYLLVSFTKIGVYKAGQLGAYTGEEAIINVTLDGVTNWTEGQWAVTSPTTKIQIYPTYETSLGFGTRLWSYTLKIDNRSFSDAVTNLRIQIWAYKGAERYRLIHTHDISSVAGSETYNEYVDTSIEAWINTDSGIDKLTIEGNITGVRFDVFTPIYIMKPLD